MNRPLTTIVILLCIVSELYHAFFHTLVLFSTASSWFRFSTLGEAARRIYFGHDLLSVLISNRVIASHSGLSKPSTLARLHNILSVIHFAIHASVQIWWSAPVFQRIFDFAENGIFREGESSDSSSASAIVKAIYIMGTLEDIVTHTSSIVILVSIIMLKRKII